MYNQRYQYSDLRCEFCADKRADCALRLCRHIIGNLPDLLRDDDFCEAVANGEKCGSRQRVTLIYLRNHFTEKGCDCVPYADDEMPEHCEYKPECVSCRYSGHGFICHSEHDGDCLRDWISNIKQK